MAGKALGGRRPLLPIRWEELLRLDLPIPFVSEEARWGIRVNCVSPGLIDNGYLPPEQAKWMEARVPSGRLGRAEEVAAAVAFLVSDEASYISGANLSVADGWDWIDRPTDHDHGVQSLFLGADDA